MARRYKKVCPICGKTFYSTKKRIKSCSKDCADIARMGRGLRHICWECENTNDSCPHFQKVPFDVPLWKTVPDPKSKNGYYIISCPNFKRWIR